VSGAIRSAESRGTILVTGGAGFVGTNIAKRLASQGWQVRILDSLARSGSESNIDWLLDRFPDTVEFLRGDVRDRNAVAKAVDGVEHIYHLAAQVAVTTSLINPQQDFEVNAQGTLNVLEAARLSATRPSVLYSSTNKVYGALADLDVVAHGRRYMPENEQVRSSGVSEGRGLEFHSPYGCSKGAAEQYVLDYSRSFGLRTVVFRMSCIYGPHQHGNEDQGWVAHFLRRAMADESVTIYGDGKQVRDVLFVDDLIDAFELARRNIDRLSARAFNMGGGTANTVSVLEVLDSIERVTGQHVERTLDEWRVGDQRYYVSDTSAFHEATGWQPKTTVAQGLAALHGWYEEQQSSRAPIAVNALSNASLAEARP
jgi:CDP-paratose 2-epimerase